MGLGIRLAGTVALLAVAAGAQGCVTIGQYEELQRKLDATATAYSHADTVVGRLKKDIEMRDLEIQRLRVQAATADQRVQNATLALEAKFSDLQTRYKQLLEQLEAEGGGDFTINKKTNGLVLSDDIFFQPGRAELRDDKKAILDKVVAKLRSPEFAHAQIEIGGHTDSDPIQRSKWADNYELSCARARNVLIYFAKKGIPEDRMYIAGYGPNKPRGEKKADNRRVEIVLEERG